MAVSSPEDVINIALRDIGWLRPISDLYEGTKAARVALDIYSETRDEIIRSADWAFARRVVPLTLVKGPPPPGGYNPVEMWDNTYAPPPWLYEYAYPSDVVEFCAVMSPPGPLPVLDPKPARWRRDNDQNLPGAPSVILCDLSHAIGIYRGRVTNPQTWDVGFVATLVAALAKKMSPLLAAGQNTRQDEEQQLQQRGMAAIRHRG